MDLEKVQNREELRSLINSNKWYRARKMLQKEGIIDAKEYRKISRCGTCKLKFINGLKDWLKKQNAEPPLK